MKPPKVKEGQVGGALDNNKEKIIRRIWFDHEHIVHDLRLFIQFKNKIKFIPKHINILLFGYELKVPSNELTLWVKIELVKLALVNLDLAMKLQT